MLESEALPAWPDFLEAILCFEIFLVFVVVRFHLLFSTWLKFFYWNWAYCITQARSWDLLFPVTVKTSFCTAAFFCLHLCFMFPEAAPSVIICYRNLLCGGEELMLWWWCLRFQEGFLSAVLKNKRAEAGRAGSRHWAKFYWKWCTYIQQSTQRTFFPSWNQTDPQLESNLVWKIRPFLSFMVEWVLPPIPSLFPELASLGYFQGLDSPTKNGKQIASWHRSFTTTPCRPQILKSLQRVPSIEEKAHQDFILENSVFWNG